MEVPRQFSAAHHQVWHPESVEFHSKTGILEKAVLLLFVVMIWFTAFKLRKAGLFGDGQYVSPQLGFRVVLLLGFVILVAGFVMWNNRYVVFFDTLSRQVRLRVESIFSSDEVPYPYEDVTLRIYDEIVFKKRDPTGPLGQEALVLEVGGRQVILAASWAEEVREIADRLAEETGLEYSEAPDYLELVWN